MQKMKKVYFFICFYFFLVFFLIFLNFYEVELPAVPVLPEAKLGGCSKAHFASLQLCLALIEFLRLIFIFSIVGCLLHKDTKPAQSIFIKGDARGRLILYYIICIYILLFLWFVISLYVPDLLLWPEFELFQTLLSLFMLLIWFLLLLQFVGWLFSKDRVTKQRLIYTSEGPLSALAVFILLLDLSFSLFLWV